MTHACQRSHNAIAALLGAAAFAVFTTGTAVAASTTAVSITDAGSGVKAHVTSKASLVTSDRDPYSGVYARNDAAGRRLIGDGSGALTVDGVVMTRPAAPAVWSRAKTGLIASGTSYGETSIQLPASGVLTVRAVSVRATLPKGQHANGSLLVTERDGTELRLPLTFTPQGLSQQSVYEVVVATFAEDLFPKPGTPFYISMERSTTTDVVSFEVSLLGRLA